MTYKIVTKRIKKTKKQRWQERVVFGRPKALKICKYPTYISYLHSQISSAIELVKEPTLVFQVVNWHQCLDNHSDEMDPRL